MVATAVPDDFDARAEYKALLDAVKPPTNEDAGYQHLMSREKRVLDTVDRLVNDSWRKDADSRSFLQLPLHEIGVRVMSTTTSLLDDLVAARSAQQVFAAFATGDRKIYVGVLLVALALALFFISASS
jgi:hypothetical protein